MTVQTLRGLDPGPRTLLPILPPAHWDTLWADLSRPEGLLTRHLPGPQYSEDVQVVVAWWRDLLGRRHWAIRQGHPSEVHLEIAPDIDKHHPLEWIAPPLSTGWRDANGRRELIVLCRCGVSGTPERIAWMGQCCGPCFDRQEDELPPLGHEPLCTGIPKPQRLWLSEEGILVTEHDILDETGQPGYEVMLRAFDTPEAESPRWVRVQDRVRQRFAVGDGALAVVGPESVTFVDLFDGEARQTNRHEGDGLRDAVYSGNTLLTLHPRGLYTWHNYGRDPLSFARFTPAMHTRLWPDPEGNRVLLTRERGMDLYEVRTGRYFGALSLDPTDQHETDPDRPRLVWMPHPSGSGHALAVGNYTAHVTYGLARWSDVEKAARRYGQAAMFGFATRPEILVKTPDRRTLELLWTPTGELLAVSSRSLTVYDPETLRPRVSFSPCGITMTPAATFSPDGRLLVGTSRGLAAWNWRDILG